MQLYCRNYDMQFLYTMVFLSAALKGQIRGVNLSPTLWGSKVPPLFSPPLPSSPLPLEVGPLNPVRGPGERCKLRQWVVGQSSSRQRFWCISGWRNAAGGIQDAQFEPSKMAFLLLPEYCEDPSHRPRWPSQPNYFEGPDLRTLTGSTPTARLMHFLNVHLSMGSVHQFIQ